MKHELIITFEKTFVQIISNGEKNFQTASKIWSNVIKVCKENGCYKILGIAATTKPPSTTDSVRHRELFHELNINLKYRIAWVELNPKSYESIKFIETVLYNRGLPGKLFKDIDEAKTWLLNED